MALKTTTQTLEIKTSGTGLSLVETLYVTIKLGDFQAVKSNDDIEVDGDIISVLLSQDEALRFSGNYGANVSVMAVGYDGNIFNVKIMWVKRGSQTRNSSGGGGEGSGIAWYPNVTQDGDLTWEKLETDVPPIPVNIKGERGESGAIGPPGENGHDGFSPIIAPNSDNNSENYRLDITTKSGSFTTPNLKGPKGDAGSGGGSGGGGAAIFAFEIGEDGHLYLLTDNPAVAENFKINQDGHLIYTFGEG